MEARGFRKRRLTLAKDLENDVSIAAAALSAYGSEEKEGSDIVDVYPSSKKRLIDEVGSTDGPGQDSATASHYEESDNAKRIKIIEEETRQLGIPSSLGTQLLPYGKKAAKSMTHMHMTEAFICRVRSRLLLTKASTSSPSRRRGSSTTTEETTATRQTPQVFKHDHLPFPRDIVGTFSCHGIEPLYDDDEEEESTSKDGDIDKDITPVAAKINQDRGGVAYPYANDWHTALFATYDGHGFGGENVSQYAMTEIQKRLECHPDFDSNIEKAFIDTFIQVDEDLEDQVDMEPLYSGTTACVVLLRNQTLYIANAGDSRAVLARRTSSPRNPYVAIDLSIDQNPDSPGEKERIEACGGHVSPPPEPGLSARVWLDPHFTHIGLAMSRSIGDHAVKSVGVISEPVVTKHDLIEEDEFMIIATDGVWVRVPLSFF